MANGEKGTEKATLGERLVKRLDIEPDVFLGGFGVEMRGRHRVKLCGVEKILSYADEEICLCLGHEIVLVQGARLECITFRHGNAILVGRIDGILFGKGAKT